MSGEQTPRRSRVDIVDACPRNVALFADDVSTSQYSKLFDKGPVNVRHQVVPWLVRRLDEVDVAPRTDLAEPLLGRTSQCTAVDDLRPEEVDEGWTGDSSVSEICWSDPTNDRKLPEN